MEEEGFGIINHHRDFHAGNWNQNREFDHENVSSEDD